MDIESGHARDAAGVAGTVRAVPATSAGFAWALSAADGDRLDRERTPDAVGRITAGLRTPWDRSPPGCGCRSA
ncbi:hypothetical protein ABZT06_00630 [Streptomyces sp. NPDC005483]|uniref:hypothetical protein n=1 Tax=Streptomyces sp. NPDC005483 TaxID=3154882 RepID=UPI0033B7888F